MRTPAFATVPQSLWRDVEPAPIGRLEAQARVAVVLDGDPADAEPTTSALTGQTYPAALIEVHQPGAEPAGADVLVFVGAGTRPAPEFVEAHARWHHVAGDAVVFGPVTPAGEADSLLGLVRDLTRDLTDPAGGYHLPVAEDSLSVGRELFEEAGGFGAAPPHLRRLDLAHRLHCAGALFTADSDAIARGARPELAKSLERVAVAGGSLELSHPEIAALVALPPFRDTASARRHVRPAMAVNLRIADRTPADEALATIEGILGGTMGDVELRVEVPDGHDGHDRIAEVVAGDARAGLDRSSLEEATDVPFQATVPPEAVIDPRTIADLHELMLGEEAGALHVTVPGAAPQDAMIEVVATAAWRRAKRLAESGEGEVEELVAKLAGERWLSGIEVSTRRHGVEEPQVTEHGPLAAATDLDHERRTHLRFRERADDLTERAATLAQRTVAERLRARAERRAAERVEARLAERR